MLLLIPYSRPRMPNLQNKQYSQPTPYMLMFAPSCSERHEQTKHTQDMDAAIALSSEIYKIASFEYEDNAQVTSL